MASGCDRFLEVSAAHRDVALVAADLDLSAFADDAASTVEAHDHGRLLPAVADRLDFVEVVGPGQQPLRAVEEVAEENVRRGVALIRRQSPLLRAMEQAGEIKIVGAMHDLETGAVTFLN